MERVLRLRPGDEVEVADGEGRIWTARVVGGGEVELLEARAEPRPAPALVVRLALTGPRSDTAIEKLVELGVEDISPLETAAVKGEARTDRWQRIAEAAACQAKRPRIPRIGQAVTLADALQPGAILLSHEEPDGSLDAAIARTPHPIVLLIGPEAFLPGEHGRAGGRRADRDARRPRAAHRDGGDRGRRARARPARSARSLNPRIGHDPGMSSELRRTMDRQPSDLRRIFADPAPAEEAAERLRDRTVFIVGTGTSWHGANHAGYLLRAAGLDARPIEAFDAAIGGPMPVAGDALLLLSHRNTKRYATVVRERAAALGVPTVVITGIGAGGDIETVEGETSAAFTASHLGAMARVAQIAVALGANLGDLGVVADAVAAALAGPARR